MRDETESLASFSACIGALDADLLYMTFYHFKQKSRLPAIPEIDRGVIRSTRKHRSFRIERHAIHSLDDDSIQYEHVKIHMLVNALRISES